MAAADLDDAIRLVRTDQSVGGRPVEAGKPVLVPTRHTLRLAPHGAQGAGMSLDFPQKRGKGGAAAIQDLPDLGISVRGIARREVRRVSVGDEKAARAEAEQRRDAESKSTPGGAAGGGGKQPRVQRRSTMPSRAIRLPGLARSRSSAMRSSASSLRAGSW